MKLRVLRVQRKTLEGVPRRTQEVQRRRMLNKKARTRQRMRRKLKDVAVLLYRNNIKKLRITSHIYEIF